MNVKQYIQRAFILTALSLIPWIHPALATADTPSSAASILGHMEDHAEDMVDTLLAKKAAASRDHYQFIVRKINQLHRIIMTSPSNEQRSRELLMTYSWMRVIDIEITDKSWIEAAVAANQLSGMIIQTSHFPTMMQRDIAWLDYLGREIKLLTLEDAKANSDLLNIRLITLDNTWKRIKTGLIKNFRNKPVLMQGDQLIMEIKESKTSTKTIDLADKLLEFVDLVEKANEQKPPQSTH